MLFFIDNNGGNFYSVDITSGVIRWTFPLTSGTANTVYADSYDNYFYAINALNGKKIWATPGANGGDFVNTSVYYNGAIYSANGSGNFYCLNSATGNINWKSSIWPLGSPAVTNGIVYETEFDSAGENNFLYALDAATGQIKWQLGIYEIGGSPLVANGIVYIGDGEGYLNAVDTVSGKLLWRSGAGPWTYFAQLVGNELFYATAGGTIQAVDATTGNLIWSVVLALNPFDQAGAVVANGVIYVAIITEPSMP